MKRPNFREVIITIGIVVSIYASLVFILLQLEMGAPGAHIKTTTDAIWYLTETLTTVGYGDLLPVTYWGRMIGFVFLFSSLGVYGFIIGQIASFMSTIKEHKEMGLYGTSFKNHVVIIGWNDFGKSVIDHLIGAGRQIAVVTKDKASIDIIREYYNADRVYILYSDFNNFELLEKARIKEASIVFINLMDDTEKLVYIINAKKYFTHINFVVTLDNGNLKSTFQSAGVTYAISKNEISSKLLASYMYEPDVAVLSEEIIAYAHEAHEYDMKQFLVKADNPFSGVPYEKAFFDLKKQCNVVLFGIVKNSDGEKKLIKNPVENVKIETGDYLIMLLDGNGATKLKRLFHLEEGV
jgi:voltage-gated potassium channel